MKSLRSHGWSRTENLLFCLRRPPRQPSDGHLTLRLNLLLQISITSQMPCIRARLSQYSRTKYTRLGCLSRSNRPSPKICPHQSVCKPKPCPFIHQAHSPRYRRRLHPPRVPAPYRNSRSCIVSSLTSIQAHHRSPTLRGMAVLPHFRQGHLLLPHPRPPSLITLIRP
jgi:hypothetical protein